MHGRDLVFLLLFLSHNFKQNTKDKRVRWGGEGRQTAGNLWDEEKHDQRNQRNHSGIRERREQSQEEEQQNGRLRDLKGKQRDGECNPLVTRRMRWGRGSETRPQSGIGHRTPQSRAVHGEPSGPHHSPPSAPGCCQSHPSLHHAPCLPHLCRRGSWWAELSLGQ